MQIYKVHQQYLGSVRTYHRRNTRNSLVLLRGWEDVKKFFIKPKLRAIIPTDTSCEWNTITSPVNIRFYSIEVENYGKSVAREVFGYIKGKATENHWALLHPYYPGSWRSLREFIRRFEKESEKLHDFLSEWYFHASPAEVPPDTTICLEVLYTLKESGEAYLSMGGYTLKMGADYDFELRLDIEGEKVFEKHLRVKLDAWDNVKITLS